MKSWAQEWTRGLKQWSLWLMGDAPTPRQALESGTRRDVGRGGRSGCGGGDRFAPTASSGSGQTDVVNQTNAGATGSGSGPAPRSPAGSGGLSSPHQSTHHAKPGSAAPGSTSTTAGSGGHSNLAVGPTATATSALPDFVPAVEPASAQAPSTVAAPGAPFVIGATSGDLQSHLSWSAPSDQGTSPITGYDVYAGTSAGGEYAVPLNGAVPVTGTSYVATGLLPGTTYYFTVKAINAVGLSASSNEVSATAGAPFPPVGSVGHPGCEHHHRQGGVPATGWTIPRVMCPPTGGCRASGRSVRCS